MEHRIRAAAIVVSGDRLLLVKHQRQGSSDGAWVPPGGGVEGAESVYQCAARETFEETGLTVTLDRILYVRDFVDEERSLYNLEVFILADSFEGQVTPESYPRFEREGWQVAGAEFLSRQDMAGITVFPDVLKGQLWADLASPVPVFRYLGLARG